MIKWLLLNRNPNETKRSVLNLNLEEGIGLKGRCHIGVPMRQNDHYRI